MGELTWMYKLLIYKLTSTSITMETWIMKIFSEGITTFFFCSYWLTASSTFESFYAFRWFDVTVALKFLGNLYYYESEISIMKLKKYKHTSDNPEMRLFSRVSAFEKSLPELFDI